MLVTAGPTREPIDPVRYLSNRSSGRMGYALAEAAAARGHEVLLVSGPVSLPCPHGVARVQVETAQEMQEAVASHIPSMQALIMCAAVADYRPVTVSSQKIKKDAAGLRLEMVKTVDILGSVRRGMHFTGYLVGFAAETNHLLEHARDKLHRKHCDLVVANDVSRSDIAFDQVDNEVTLLFADGRTTTLLKRAKKKLAERLIETIERECSTLQPPAKPDAC